MASVTTVATAYRDSRPSTCPHCCTVTQIPMNIIPTVMLPLALCMLHTLQRRRAQCSQNILWRMRLDCFSPKFLPPSLPPFPSQLRSTSSKCSRGLGPISKQNPLMLAASWVLISGFKVGHLQYSFNFI